jgi:hypothetical protein
VAEVVVKLRGGRLGEAEGVSGSQYFTARPSAPAQPRRGLIGVRVDAIPLVCSFGLGIGYQLSLRRLWLGAGGDIGIALSPVGLHGVPGLGRLSEARRQIVEVLNDPEARPGFLKLRWP